MLLVGFLLYALTNVVDSGRKSHANSHDRSTDCKRLGSSFVYVVKAPPCAFIANVYD